MTEDERKVLSNLPDFITIYRGYTPGKNKQGISWTLDKDKANWFANRFSSNGKVRRKQISKRDVFAFLDGRNEKEIIFFEKEQ